MGGSAAVATASEVLDDLGPTGLAKNKNKGGSADCTSGNAHING